jgi:hypothetical protein
MNFEKVVNKKDPRQIRIMVLKPADLLLYSLSVPINPPTRITRSNLNNKSSVEGMNLRLNEDKKD